MSIKVETANISINDEYMKEERYPGEVIEVPEFTVQGVVRHIIKSL